MLRRGEHHAQIGGGAPQPRVEELVRRFDQPREALRVRGSRFRVAQRLVERKDLGRLLAGAAGDGECDGLLAAAAQPQRKMHLVACERIRRRVAFDRGLAQHAIEPFIAERHPVFLGARRARPAAAQPLDAAHLEDVDIVGGETHGEVDRDGGEREVAHADQLVADVAPDELRAVDVQRAARQYQLAAGIQVRVREIDGHEHVVAPHGGAQQQQAVRSEGQRQAREEARTAVVQAFLVACLGVDVAEVVEYRKGFVLPEDQRALGHRHFGGEDVVLLPGVDQLLSRHARLLSPS